MKHTFSLFLLSFIFLGCANEEDAATLPKEKWEFYDVKGLVKSQQEKLKKMEGELTVERKVVFDGESEEKQSEASKWKSLSQQLEVFNQADLNKPVLLGAYDSMVNEEGSTKKVVYKAKKDKLTIKELRLKWEDGVLQKLSAQINDDNFYYASGKEMQLTLKNGLVSEIEIKGAQKLIGQSPLTYQVQTKLLTRP